jgi:hypothetical protein
MIFGNFTEKNTYRKHGLVVNVMEKTYMQLLAIKYQLTSKYDNINMLDSISNRQSSKFRSCLHTRENVLDFIVLRSVYIYFLLSQGNIYFIVFYKCFVLTWISTVTSFGTESNKKKIKKIKIKLTQHNIQKQENKCK